MDLQGLAVVALALADLAGDVDVRQELHLDLDDPVALAGLAAAALDVEAEAPGLVAADPGLGRAGEQLPDGPEQADVGGRVGARRPADGALVDLDDLVDVLDALDGIVSAHRLPASPYRSRARRPVEHLVHERALARPGDAGDRDERPQRERARRRRAGCALGRREPRDASRCRAARCSGTGTRALAAQEGPGDASAAPPGRPRAGRSATISPPCSPAPGPMSMIQSAVRMVSSSCSTTRTVLPRSRSRVSVRDELRVVPLVETDGRLVQDVQHAHQRRADLGRQADALGLAAREADAAPGPGSGSRAPRPPGSRAGRTISLSTWRAIVRSRSRQPGRPAPAAQCERLGHGQAGHVGDVAGRPRSRPAPRDAGAAAAGRAGLLDHELLELGPDVLRLGLLDSGARGW